jgi:hypothetical protein
MLTGQYPYRHGIRQFLRNQLNATSKTLFERLRDAGYASLASIDYLDIFRFNQLIRGAEVLPSRDDAAAIAAFEERANSGKNVFLFHHVGDVHPPYGETYYPESPADNAGYVNDYVELAQNLGFNLSPEEIAKVRTSNAALVSLSNRVRLWSIENGQPAGINFPRYIAGINRYDSLRFARFFGKLEAKGLLDETLVVITADHGHALIESDFMAKENGAPIPRKFDHGETVAEEVIRIPLVFWSKSQELRPRVWDMPVSSTDIVPTILGVLNIPFGAAEMDGINRRALMMESAGTGTEWNRAQLPSECYAEAWYHNRAALSAYLKQCMAAGKLIEPSYATHLHQQTLRAGRYKLIETAGGRAALFDTVNDPWERMNLLDYHAFYSKWDFIPNYGQIAKPLVVRMHGMIDGYPAGTGVASRGGELGGEAGGAPAIGDLESRLRELGYIE